MGSTIDDVAESCQDLDQQGYAVCFGVRFNPSHDVTGQTVERSLTRGLGEVVNRFTIAWLCLNAWRQNKLSFGNSRAQFVVHTVEDSPARVVEAVHSGHRIQID